MKVIRNFCDIQNCIKHAGVCCCVKSICNVLILCMVRGIKKLSSTGAGTDTDTGMDTGAIDNT